MKSLNVDSVEVAGKQSGGKQSIINYYNKEVYCLKQKPKHNEKTSLPFNSRSIDDRV